MYKHDAFFDITLLDILNAWNIAMFWLGNSEFNFSINADKILVNFDYQHETCGMMKKNPGGMMLVVLRVRHTPLIITKITDIFTCVQIEKKTKNPKKKKKKQ